jgi:GAF domain/PucR C-terminal helix-turn-helix domain/GGDEF-like domain
MTSTQARALDDLPVLDPSVPDVPVDDTYLPVIKAFEEVAAAIGDCQELDDLLHLIAEKITELINVRRCSLYLRDETSGLFRGQVGHWHQDIDQRVKRLVSGIHADRFTAQIVETRRPVVVQDTGSDPRPIQSTMREWKVRSMLGVPMIARDEVIGIVYLDDVDRPRTYDARDCAIAFAFAELAGVAILQARLTTALRERLSTVARQNRAMRWAVDVEDRLTRLAVDGAGVQEIAEAVAELTGKSVAIHDANFRRLAGAVPEGDTGLVPRLLEPDVRTHQRVALELERAGAGEPVIIGPILDVGLNRRSMLAAVCARGERSGWLVIAEHQSRLRSVDLQIARRAATIVAWELTSERRSMSPVADALEVLAVDVLRGAVDTKTLDRRAHHIGFEPARPRVVAMLAPAPGRTLPDPDDAKAAFIAAAGDGADVIIAPLGAEMAVLLSLPEERTDWGQVTESALASLAPRSSLRAGVSAPCRTIRALRSGADAAQQTLRCLRAFCDDQVTVLEAADVGPARVLFAGCDPNEVNRFADDLLGQLHKEVSGRKMLETLAAFIDCGHSVRTAALTLDVHENSIRYRLSRIEELTGLSVLTDADDQVQVQLAIVAMRLRGTLARRRRSVVHD